MKFVDSKFEIIEQPSGMDGLVKHIEKAARICYKSENRTTDDSAKNMVNALIKNKHTAMLEHGTIYLYYEDNLNGDPEIALDVYETNPYSVVKNRWTNNDTIEYFVTTNYRVIIENGLEEDLEYMCEPLPQHEKRYTVKFTTNIKTTRELLRHRTCSFANESTRWCCYSSSRFGNELTYIIPQWLYRLRNEMASYMSVSGQPKLYLLSLTGEDLVRQMTHEDRAVATWYDTLYNDEKNYINLTSGENGYKLTAEEASDILPLATKSEIIMTGFKKDWIHFFNLRSYIAMTGRPHPDIMILASNLLFEFEERGYIKHEELYNRQASKETKE